MGAGEQRQGPARLVEAGAGQRRDRVRVQVGAGMQAQQPERTRGIQGYLLDRPGEDLPYGPYGSLPASSSSSRAWRSASSVTNSASVLSGRATTSSAATRNASGSRAHCSALSALHSIEWILAQEWGAGARR
ncbi:hypothetical protein AAH979_41645 [Plantactinospora sp. ZYX-F-223]